MESNFLAFLNLWILLYSHLQLAPSKTLHIRPSASMSLFSLLLRLTVTLLIRWGGWKFINCFNTRSRSQRKLASARTRVPYPSSNRLSRPSLPLRALRPPLPRPTPRKQYPSSMPLLPLLSLDPIVSSTGTLHSVSVRFSLISASFCSCLSLFLDLRWYLWGHGCVVLMEVRRCVVLEAVVLCRKGGSRFADLICN